MMKNNIFELLLHIIDTSIGFWITLYIMQTFEICEKYVKIIDFYFCFCYNIMYENFSNFRHSQTNK